METYPKSFIRFTLLLLAAIGLILAISTANAQTGQKGSTQEEVATVVNSGASNSNSSKVPAFTGYRGVSINMTAEEVRTKLNGLKQSKAQDFFAFSEQESAQFYYDESGKVMAISIDYFGGSNAPSPAAVLGTALTAKPDGSMYKLSRYPEAGYWVSYNRTAGDNPIVTITMQRL